MKGVPSMTDWPRIVSRHTGLVWRTAYSLLGRPDEAVDCLQATFLAALELSRQQRVRDYPSLLTRICTNRAIDQLRQRLRRRHRVNGLAKWSTVPSPNSGSVESAQAVELSARLRLALTQLPARQAEVFCMRFLNDLSYRDIARQLGIKVSAVAVLLHRARLRLRELLSRSNSSGNVEK